MVISVYVESCGSSVGGQRFNAVYSEIHSETNVISSHSKIVTCSQRAGVQHEIKSAVRFLGRKLKNPQTIDVKIYSTNDYAKWDFENGIADTQFRSVRVVGAGFLSRRMREKAAEILRRKAECGEHGKR